MTSFLSVSRLLAAPTALLGLALLAPALSGCSGGDPFCEALDEIVTDAKFDFAKLGTEKLPPDSSGNDVTQAEGTVLLPGMRRCDVTRSTGIMSYDCEVSFEDKDEAIAEMRKTGEKIIACFDEVESDLQDGSVMGVEDVTYTVPHPMDGTPIAIAVQMFEHADYIVSVSISRK